MGLTSGWFGVDSSGRGFGFRMCGASACYRIQGLTKGWSRRSEVSMVYGCTILRTMIRIL